MELNYFISNNFLFAEADQEYWNYLETSATLKNNCEIKLFSEFRFRDDMENHYNFLGFGIRKKINSWISISESYKHIFFKKENEWKQEYRPYFDLKLIKQFNKCNLSNRSRIELRLKSDDNSLRYRNKVGFKLTNYFSNLQPSIYEEIFYDFKVNELNKNRIYLGLSFPIIYDFSGNIYYLFESNKKDTWNNTNVLIINMKYNF